MKSAESSPVDTLSPVLQQDGTARRQALSRARGKSASWATALTNPLFHMSPLTSVSMYTLTLPAQKGGRASTRRRSLPRPRYGACSTVIDTATHSASSSIAPAGAATPASRFVPVHPRLCREPAGIFKVRNAMQKQARDRLLYERYRPNLHRPMLPMHPDSRERGLRTGSIVAIPSCNPGVPPGPTEH